MKQEPFRKKSLVGWYIYDFTNSIAMVIGGIYFSKWFIQDLGGNSILFNILFLSSALIILILGRKIGAIIDIQGYKKWIINSSLVSALMLFLLFGFSQMFDGKLIIVLTFPTFLLFLLSYQVSRICHNTYLKQIIPEITQSKVSGYGSAFNWLGSVFGILITIPIVMNFSGSFARELTFLIAAVSFSILTPISLKLMFLSKNDKQSSTPFQISNDKKKSLRSIFPEITLIFICYFLLFDVLSTVQRNLPPFLSSVHNLNDTIQSYGFLLILLGAVIGGVFSAKKINASNSTIWIRNGGILLLLGIILITLPWKFSLWIAFPLAGFSYGMLESTVRVHYMQTFKNKLAGEKFGQLAAVERASGFFGPILWIIPFSLVSNEESANITAMLFLCFILLIAIRLTYSNKFKKADSF